MSQGDQSDPFKEYGHESKSIQESLEEFMFDFILKGLPPPTKIYLPNSTLRALNAELIAKMSNEQYNEIKDKPTIVAMMTNAGQIEIRSSEDDK